MTPPIIIIHRGDSHYLAHCIAQAKSSNPDSDIILIGDRSNSYYLGVKHHHYMDYFSSASSFAEKYEYKYNPNYQYPWQLFCHQRHFILKEFCQNNEINRFVYIDSDVMVYEDINRYFNIYAGSSITLISEPHTYTAGAWFSMVQDLEIVVNLCDIYNKLFSESGRETRERLGLETINDMTGLYLLMEKYPRKVTNVYNYEGQDYVMNLSMEWDNRFEYDGKFLKVIWIENIPYLTEKSSKGLLRAPMLHFHGKGKYVMGKHLKIKGGKIVVQHLINKTINSLIKYPARLVNTIHKEFFPKI
jgi:hypothetical protein